MTDTKPRKGVTLVMSIAIAVVWMTLGFKAALVLGACWAVAGVATIIGDR